MVSGGIKVVVKTGRILKQGLPSKINPFIRIKAGSRIADSRHLALESITDDISWNESLSLVFKDDTQLMIQLLDADKKIPNYNFEIGVCTLNLEMLQITQKQSILGVFHNNSKLAALIELEIVYEPVLEEKVEQASPDTAAPIRRAETEVFDEEEEPVYEKLSLNFKVLQATLTHDTEALGDMKPYCLIKINYKEYKTDILKGKNPKWNQVFIFDDVKPDMSIQLGVWDKETVKEDDLVGKGRISVGQIMKQQSRIFEIPIYYYDLKTEKKGGTVKVEARVF